MPHQPFDVHGVLSAKSLGPKLSPGTDSNRFIVELLAPGEAIQML